MNIDEKRQDIMRLAKANHQGKQPQFCYAVTGTCGKTSTCFFLYQIFCLLGLKAAYIGTEGVHNNAGCEPRVNSQLTTPSANDIHALLEDLFDAGVTHLAIEATSHGLDQYRIHGMDLYAVAFTNLSRDHLDYHEDMEHYFLSKQRLFTDFSPQLRVTNEDDAYGQRLRPLCNASYGSGSRFHLNDNGLMIDGALLPFEQLAIVGEFQYQNLCCAIALIVLSGLASGEQICALAPRIQTVPGRLEKIHDWPMVIIDFAHKPEAMSVVLKTLRPLTKGRIITVFGCGGDRDAGKRPIMGEIAHDLSDIVIVTDDNARSEDPTSIRQQILATCPNGIDGGERRNAIDMAIKMAQPDDTIAILGRGAEQFQKIKDQRIPFEDKAVTLELLQ